MTPQEEEIQRLKARYQTLLQNPDFGAVNLKILHSALADRMLNSLPGKDVPMQLPPDFLGDENNV